MTDQNSDEKFKALKRFGRDLVEEARKNKIDPVIGRDDEIRQVIQTLSRRRKNNPVLIGEPGVGKTAIAEGLALRIALKDVPTNLLDTRVVALDLGMMVAGTQYRGQFEERIEGVLREVKEAKGRIILFIDELHSLVGAGDCEGGLDASNMLKPALARGDLRCIGATTLDEYRKYIEKDAALERRFQTVLINEPTVDDSITILHGLKGKYERHHQVRITYSAIIAAVKLSHRYVADRFLPDKAIDLIDTAASSLRMEIDSVPAEIDELTRKITAKDIERRALKKESDGNSAERMTKVEQEIAGFRERLDSMQASWHSEKKAVELISELNKLILDAREGAKRAAREGDYAKASQYEYGDLYWLGKELKLAEGELERIQAKSKFLREEVSADDIAKIVSKWTGVPVSKMVEEEQVKLLQIEDRLRKRVIGQDHALELVADAVRRSRCDLADPNRPVGSYIFLGQTGVGKTETARALAEYMFDDEQAIVRIDMSEYMDKHSIARFIGSPPGYIGYDEGGYLTEAVRRRPYSVILFDEIEKAHPDVYNVLLQILDDGRLTDGQGRTVNFCNTIIIMTSNVGSEHIVRIDDGLMEEERHLRVEEALRGAFRPEFLNRIDEIIHFHPLTEQDIEEIIDIQLGILRKRLAERKITIRFTAKAKRHLVSLGYDPAYGARPLKRSIQKYIINPLSRKLLEGSIGKNKRIIVDLRQGRFTFTPYRRVSTLRAFFLKAGKQRRSNKLRSGNAS